MTKCPYCGKKGVHTVKYGKSMGMSGKSPVRACRYCKRTSVHNNKLK